MKKILAILAFLLAFPLVFSPAQASELDNEEGVTNASRLSRNLPQTLVVKVSDSGSVAVLHSSEKLSAGAALDESAFVEMKATDSMKNELDTESSTSGWYFYWYNYSYSYPTYYYYGYTYSYRPYYSYYYNHSWYYWYRW